MKFTIQKDVPLPTNMREEGVSATLKLMNVGDSVVDTELNDVRVKTRWHSAASRQQRGVSIRQEKDASGKLLGFRVWRTK
jgi:hypothetical protein